MKQYYKNDIEYISLFLGITMVSKIFFVLYEIKMDIYNQRINAH